MSPFGVSADAHEVGAPQPSRSASKTRDTMPALESIGTRMGDRFSAEGHSYRRFTIEVWANRGAIDAISSGMEAPIGSEIVAVHFEGEKETAPVLYLAMRKERQDGGVGWTYRAYDAKREAIVLDQRPCASCHAMARFDGRFTVMK